MSAPQRDIVIISLDLTSVLGLIPHIAPTTSSGVDTNCCNDATSSATRATRASTEPSSSSSSSINADLTITVGGGAHISTSNILTPAPTVSAAVTDKQDRNNLGPIIGGVVSGLVFLFLIAILCCFLRRRRISKLHRVVSPYDREKPLVETPAMRISTGPPKSHNINLVANRVQVPLIDEPVEAGLMSGWRHPTTLQP